jgi:hypothetical protein
MRRFAGLVAALGVALALTSGTALAAASGPPHLGIYADGQLYRTIGTPTDFSGTGAPVSSFEPLYALGGDLVNVAEAAPGQPGFRGGRWIVLPVTWHTTPSQLTSSSQVHALAGAGLITIGTVPLQEFECPLIRVPRGGH